MAKRRKKRKGPTKYRAEYAGQAERLCAGLQASVHGLAMYFDVDARTIGNWAKQHPEFMLALKRGVREGRRWMWDGPALTCWDIDRYYLPIWLRREIMPRDYLGGVKKVVCKWARQDSRIVRVHLCGRGRWVIIDDSIEASELRVVCEVELTHDGDDDLASWITDRASLAEKLQRRLRQYKLHLEWYVGGDCTAIRAGNEDSCVLVYTRSQDSS